MSKTATPHLPFLADPSSAPRLPKTESSQIYDSSRQRPRQSDSVRLKRKSTKCYENQCLVIPCHRIPGASMSHGWRMNGRVALSGKTSKGTRMEEAEPTPSSRNRCDRP